MAAADLAKVVARVNWLIGARSSSFNDTVNDDRFDQEEIRRAVIETEGEVVRCLCESNHPMRTDFLAWSANVAHGDTLPKHLGQVEAVRIEKFNAGVTVPGELTSRENIRLWRDNTNYVFDAVNHDGAASSLSGYYNITNNSLYFTGFSAQVKICTYDPDYTTPALQVDEMFENALVAGTIIKLNKVGVPQALIVSYGQLYMQQMALIQQGSNNMPSLPIAQATE